MTYEDLVANPAAEVSRALAHIDVVPGVDLSNLTSRYQKIETYDPIYEQMRLAVR